MPLHMAFWLLMTVLLVAGIVDRAGGSKSPRWLCWGIGLLTFLAIALLGSEVFGDAIK